MGINIHIQLNKNLFLRDPQDTKLGRTIIQHSIYLIDEIGIENFTFKKLAEKIGSAEASIYRYFENKHLLLVYLLCWYWEWMKYLLEINTTNIEDPRKKLQVAIMTIVDSAMRQEAIDFVDEDILHRIVVAESTKSYYTKQVDEENKQGFFLTYKALSLRIAEIIREVNPDFAYPKSLASTLLDMAKNHVHYAQHLPSLTDVRISGEDYGQVKNLLLEFAFKLLDARPVVFGINGDLLPGERPAKVEGH
jgi:AcrR family transcriptional regulator